MVYRDSVGNTYSALPAKKPNSGAKGAKPGPKNPGVRKKKYDNYRSRVGKPRGRGVPGNKSGANSG